MEDRSLETLVRTTFSNTNGMYLLDEFRRMYVDKLSFQDGMDISFEDAAFKEGQKSVILMIIDILDNADD